MTQPLPAPTFTAGYTTPLTDIGSGYAKGIAAMGEGISGAIRSVMGGINPQTGEAQEGILQQGASAHQMIDVLHGAGVIGDDEYATLKTANLGAQQKAIGMYSGMLASRYQNVLDMQRQQAALNAAMAREQVSGQTSRDVANIGAQARVQAAEQRAAEAERRLAEAQQNKLVQNPKVLNAPTQQNPQNPQVPGGPLPIPPTLKLGI